MLRTVAGLLLAGTVVGGCAVGRPATPLVAAIEQAFHAAPAVSARDHAAASRLHELESDRLLEEAFFYRRTGRECSGRWRHHRHVHYRRTACGRDFEARYRDFRDQARVHETLARHHRRIAKELAGP